MAIRLIYAEGGVNVPVDTNTLLYLMKSKSSHPEFRKLDPTAGHNLLVSTLDEICREGRIEKFTNATFPWKGPSWKVRGLLDQLAWASRDSKIDG